MAKIFVALYNFCRKPDNYCDMPPFFDSFLKGLEKAGNEVKCYQTKKITNRGFETNFPPGLSGMLRYFKPDLCILFNNNFWDISKVVDCPIIIYDVDSPLEWQLKDNLKNNRDRYLYVYNQTKAHDEIVDMFFAEEKHMRYIPFFSEVHADDDTVPTKNIVFNGTNWAWKGFDFLGSFIKNDPMQSDKKKAIEVINEFIKYPFLPSHEIYYKLQNCPHDRINLGDLRRAAIEISGYRRLRYLSAVADLGLEIHGNFWNIEMMNHYPDLLACYNSEEIWTKDESEKFYNSAKIAINTKHIQALNGFSFRACDILASNACLITEKSTDLDKLFPDVRLPSFETPVEAREQCERILNNEGLRKEIVAAAHEAIDKRFRFKNVLDELEDFTGLKLHSDKTGSLDIFPSEDPEKMDDRESNVPVPAKTAPARPAPARPVPANPAPANPAPANPAPAKPAPVKFTPAAVPSRPVKVGGVKKLYYNTLGKHLGYDPYNKFRKEYTYLGKIPIIKTLIIDEYRKEKYLGFIPLVSHNYINGKKTVRFLLGEKIIRAFKKLFGSKKKKEREAQAAVKPLAAPAPVPEAVPEKAEVKAPIAASTPKAIPLAPPVVAPPAKNDVVPEIEQADKHFSVSRPNIARIREKIEAGEKVKIVLFVSRINCWMFEDIYKLFDNDDRFETYIVVKPFLSRGVEHMVECMEETYNELVRRGYSPIKGYDYRKDRYYELRKKIDPDIIFYTKYWKPHFHKNFYITEFSDRMTLLIDYGYNVTGHKEAVDFELQNMVDIYFYYSPIQKEIVSKLMKNKGKNVEISGAPKLDKIFMEGYEPVDCWKPQDRPKKRVIWAPHHEDKTPSHMYQFDAIYYLYDVMLDIAKKYENEVQFAFKPHPLLKVKLYKYWGEEATENYYNRWAELSNGQLHEGEFTDLFLKSDAMILDCLSFIAEYTATCKPFLFTVTPTSRVYLNDLGYQIYDMQYEAKGDLEKEICNFIEDVVINGNDEKIEMRTEFVRENMLPPNGISASQNVYNTIMEYIEKG